MMNRVDQKQGEEKKRKCFIKIRPQSSEIFQIDQEGQKQHG